MKKTFVLRFSVTFDADEYDEQTIVNNLEYVAQYAMDDGLVTMDADKSTVIEWGCKVETLKEEKHG